MKFDGMPVYRAVTIPKNCHPKVRFLFEEMNRQRCTISQMAERSGINKNTFKDWRTRTNPTIDNLEACYAVIGFELVQREIK